jgi:signal transduction histidine kinase
LAETTIQACSISAGFHRLALVRLGAIALLLILCLAHAAHDSPVPPALPFAICLMWTAFAVCYWALQRAARRQGARPAAAEKEAWRHHWNGAGALSAHATHEISTPVSTMLLVVNELRRSPGTPPPDWQESIDTIWAQLQQCKRALNAAAHPEDRPPRYVDSDLATSVTFESGEQG